MIRTASDDAADRIQHRQMLAARALPLLLLLGSGTGIGLRGLVGGLHIIMRPMERRLMPSRTAVVELALPREEENEKEKKEEAGDDGVNSPADSAGTSKYASLKLPPPKDIVELFADKFIYPLFEISAERRKALAAGQKPTFREWFVGGVSKTNPLLMALAIPGVPAAMWLGYKGMDTLIDKLRSQELEEEYAAAKQEFREEAVEALRAREEAKEAAEAPAMNPVQRELDATLDALYTAKFTKRGTVVDEILSALPWEAISTIGGGAVGLALLTALMAGKLSYDYHAARSTRAITEKAIKEHERKLGFPPTEVIALV